MPFTPRTRRSLNRIGFAHGEMQANADAHGPAARGGAALHVGDALRHLRRFTPGEIDVAMFGGDVAADREGTAEIRGG